MRTGVPAIIALMALLLFCGKAAARPGKTRPVTFTLGSVERKNWQHNLVRTNPNLGHFHWNPIYSSIQSTHLVRSTPPPPRKGNARPSKRMRGQRPNPNIVFHPAAVQRPSFYKKHMPLKIAPRKSTRTSFEYTHAPLPTAPRKSTSLSYTHAPLPVARRDASGRLIQPQPTGKTTLAQLTNRQIAASCSPPSEQPMHGHAQGLGGVERHSVSARMNPPHAKQPNHHSSHVSGKLKAGKKTAHRKMTSPRTLTYKSYESTSGYGIGGRYTTTSVKGRLASHRNY